MLRVSKARRLQHLHYTILNMSGPMWAHFATGDRKNESQNKAYCKGCIEHYKAEHPLQLPENPSLNLQAREEWEKQGVLYITLEVVMGC